MVFYKYQNLVFHRILDFKAGLDFYLGPFLFGEKCIFFTNEWRLNITMSGVSYPDSGPEVT